MVCCKCNCKGLGQGVYFNEDSKQTTISDFDAIYLKSQCGLVRCRFLPFAILFRCRKEGNLILMRGTVNGVKLAYLNPTNFTCGESKSLHWGKARF